jgi:site-specific recombinase XerC
MSNYANRTRRAPRTLKDAERQKILKVTGEHRAAFRDHVIISVALGTGLRQSELVALDVGDVRRPDGGVRRTIELRVYKRAGAGADPKDQQATFPDGTFYKLEKYVRTQRYHAEDTDPLFPARGGGRLSTRRLRAMFRHWQEVAGFDRIYPFHALRHTTGTTVRRETGDIRIAQKVLRHANIQTTTIYDHPSDQEVLDAVKDMKT